MSVICARPIAAAQFATSAKLAATLRALVHQTDRQF